MWIASAAVCAFGCPVWVTRRRFYQLLATASVRPEADGLLVRFFGLTSVPRVLPEERHEQEDKPCEKARESDER